VCVKILMNDLLIILLMKGLHEGKTAGWTVKDWSHDDVSQESS